MSATNRSDVRRDLDFYETPAWCTNAILDQLPTCPTASVLEPGCGTGAIARVLRERGFSNVTGIELDPLQAEQAKQECYTVAGNFLDPLRYWGVYDLVIGNPPCSEAEAFVRRARSLGDMVAMLLRLNWLSGQKRAEFHRQVPAHVYVLPRRPSFTGDGKTDATEYAWFVWGDDHPGRWEILVGHPHL